MPISTKNQFKKHVDFMVDPYQLDKNYTQMYKYLPMKPNPTNCI